MRGLLILVLSLTCACSNVECWYVGEAEWANPTSKVPYAQVKGRCGLTGTCVFGPIFQEPQTALHFIQDAQLPYCGGTRGETNDGK